jgi:hypothetical protein
MGDFFGRWRAAQAQVGWFLLQRVFEGYMTKEAAVARDQSQFGRCLQLLACSVVIGLSIPAAWFGFRRLSVMWPINTPSWLFITSRTLICLGTYLSVGLLFSAIRRVRTFAFNWALLSICGSFVLAVIYTFKRLLILQLSSSNLPLDHFQDPLGTAFWLSIFTLPISAFVYYSTSFFFTRASNS